MTERILDLIDAGSGTVAGYGGIIQSECTRQGCHRAVLAGSGFCAPCLAWLRLDSDDEPPVERF